MLQGFLPKISTEVRPISGGLRRILKSLKTYKKCHKTLWCSFLQTQPPNACKVHLNLFCYALAILREIQFAQKTLQILFSVWN